MLLTFCLWFDTTLGFDHQIVVVAVAYFLVNVSWYHLLRRLKRLYCPSCEQQLLETGSYYAQANICK